MNEDHVKYWLDGCRKHHVFGCKFKDKLGRLAGKRDSGYWWISGAQVDADSSENCDEFTRTHWLKFERVAR